MSSATQARSALSWEDSLQLPATPATLEMLFAGQIAGLCVPDFLTAEECANLKQRAGQYEFENYLNVVPRIEKVGITVFEFDQIGKKEYFAAVESANQRIARLTDGICSPLQRVVDWLSALSPNRRVGVAQEPGLGPYFAGLFRRIERGTLIHVDFAPTEQPGWAVAQVCSQLTFNIYLDVSPIDPGLVHVWQRQVRADDESFKIPESYGYTPEVVKDVPFATITPQRGMLMVINTRNFHQVCTAGGSRLAISSAVGQLPDKNLVLWS
jgi:hypothetical protein